MSAPPPDVTAVVVSYNSAAFLPGCLTSILARDDATPGIDVVVVDNASSDDSVAVAAGYGPRVRVLRNDRNVGFGAAVNRGASTSQARYLLLVNPDAVLAPRAVAELVAFADAHPAHGLYGGRAVGADGALDPKSCWGLPSLWSMFCFATGLSAAFGSSRLCNPTVLPGWQRDSVREVGAVSGCLLLARRTAWEALGGFDEAYFLYGEDIDLGARAWAAGLRPVVVPGAAVCHSVGASTPEAAERTILLLSGRATYLRRRWGQPRRLLGLGFLRAGVALRAAAELAAGRGSGRGRGRRWRTAWASRDRWAAGYADPSRSSPGRPARRASHITGAGPAPSAQAVPAPRRARFARPGRPPQPAGTTGRRR